MTVALFPKNLRKTLHGSMDQQSTDLEHMKAPPPPKPIRINSFADLNAVKSCVYFIRDHESRFIKIGTTANIVNRCKTIKTGNPHPLYLIGLYVGGKELESQLQVRFGIHHHDGEWYKFHEDFITFLGSNQLAVPVNLVWKATWDGAGEW